MAFQTFMRSCTFAAAATLLQDEGFTGTTDVEVCRLSRVPWVWIQAASRDFQTGSAIVDGRFLDAAATHFGLAFHEERLDVEALPAYLRHLGCRAMISIRSAAVPQSPDAKHAPSPTAGHAVVVSAKAGGWRVENMRREGSDTPTTWYWTDTELMTASRSGIVGHLTTGAGKTAQTAVDALQRDTLDTVFPNYRPELLRLWASPIPRQEFRNLLPGMFDGLFLEGPALMAAVQEQELAEQLGTLRDQIAQLLRSQTDVVHLDSICSPRALAEQLDTYETMLRQNTPGTPSSP